MMEFISKLQYLFITLFVVGFGLPLLNVILGAFASGADAGTDASGLDTDLELDVDFDAAVPDTDLPDLDTADIVETIGTKAGSGRGLIRFNVNCLCLALVVFSAVSYYRVQFVTNIASLVLVLAVDGAIALAAYVLLYRLVVKKLKDNDASALRAKSLLHQRGIVRVPIIEGQIGKIELKDALGAPITYLAKIDRDICKHSRINIEEEVLITEIDRENNICYVTIPDTKLLKKE